MTYKPSADPPDGGGWNGTSFEVPGTATQGSAALATEAYADSAAAADHTYGSMHLTATAATTIGSQSTKAAVIDGNNYVKAAGTTVLGAEVLDWSMPANNRLRYDGTPTVLARVHATVSVTPATGNDVLGLKLAKGGAVIDETFVTRKMDSTPGDIGACSISALVSMATTDYLEVFVANETAGRNLTITAMNMVVSTEPA